MVEMKKSWIAFQLNSENNTEEPKTMTEWQAIV